MNKFSVVLYKKINSAMMLGVLALTTACSNDIVQQDEPKVDSAFSAAFVKEFGVIDPKQDWNSAEQAVMRLYPGDEPVDEVLILVESCGNYYLAARYTDISEVTTMRVEVPERAKIVMCVDGELYPTRNGGTVDLRARSRSGASRATIHPAPVDFTNLGWIIAAEDLGDTNDTDFNDVVIRLEYVTDEGGGTPGPGGDEPEPGPGGDEPDPGPGGDEPDPEPDPEPEPEPDSAVVDFDLDHLGWEKDDNDVILKRPRSRTGEAKNIKVTALAAGGTLPVWLHFIGADNVDYIISPNVPNGYIRTADVYDVNADKVEWHRWFGSNSLNMINTKGGSTRGGNVVLPYSLTGDFTFTDYSSSYNAASGHTMVVKGFYITVGTYMAANSTVISAPARGAAPHMFLIPDIGWKRGGSESTKGWLWPTERTPIKRAYSYFANWVGNASAYSEWYTEEVTPGTNVYNRQY